MKNKLVAKIMGNELANRVISEITKFCRENEGLLLTLGTIGFSWTATVLAVKNAAEIHYILEDYKVAVMNCNTKEEKNKLCVLTLKSLMPLVSPIIIFEGAATAFAIFSKRRTDRIEMKLSETAGALALLQTAVTQYQAFAREAEDTLGPEKVHEIQKEIADNTIYEVSRAPVNTKTSDDEQLIYEPITGQVFWSTPDRVNLAWEKYKTEVMGSEKHFVPVCDVFFDRLGADSRTCAAEVFGYYNEDASKMSDQLYLDGIKVIINGKEMAALKINYYPSIRLVTDEVFD